MRAAAAALAVLCVLSCSPLVFASGKKAVLAKTDRARPLGAAISGGLLGAPLTPPFGTRARHKLPVSSPSLNCTTCENKEQCCGGELCCSGGTFCCAKGSQCCNDTCCDAFSQDCCPDKKNGGVCCEREDTFCCPAQPDMDLPSRCCPRWFVCCDKGRYGCCDPATLKPLEEFQSLLAQVKQTKKKEVEKKAKSGPNVWALMVIPGWEGGNPMYSFSFDVSTSEKTHQSPDVTGFNTWDEMTRKFAFDGKSKAFYLPQANFTGPGKPHSRKIHLYKVDAVTGKTTRREVAGVGASGSPKGLVTGFALDAKTGSLVMATRHYSSSSSSSSLSGARESAAGDMDATGYDFWHVDTATGKATHLSMQDYGSSGGKDTYAGYFKTLARGGPSGGELRVFRLGYLNVVQSLGPGMGITDISAKVAKYSWRTIIPPASYDFLLSLSVANANSTEFVGMAASTSVLDNDLSLFRWTTAGSPADPIKPTLVAKLGDANNTPHFGPLGFDVSPDFSTFAALTVHDTIDSNYDLWALSKCDLATSTASTAIVDPWMMAQTDSISGFGFEQ
jgi:hypothetical protein